MYYVGWSQVCFCDAGNNVICYDIDDKKINSLEKGEVPIYEPELQTKLQSNLKSKNLHFSSDLTKICSQNDVLFIAVGTPSNPDGSADLKNLFLVAKNIGQNIDRELSIVIKSTVPVGTTIKVKELIMK